MTPDRWLVTVAGLVLIGGIVWWFFIAPRRRVAVAATRPASGGVQEVLVTVDGGYAPDPIEVVAERPVRLNFHRVDHGSCSEEVVLGAFGIRRFLPPDEVTPVEFTPAAPGRYEYTCGMGMLRGTVIVVPARGPGGQG